MQKKKKIQQPNCLVIAKQENQESLLTSMDSCREGWWRLLFFSKHICLSMQGKIPLLSRC